jgi:hypothetical protein
MLAGRCLAGVRVLSTRLVAYRASVAEVGLDGGFSEGAFDDRGQRPGR